MGDEIELLRLVSELIPEPTTDAWTRAKAAIAAAREEEDLCRSGTERPARDLRARAGLTRRVARRRRRLAVRSVAAAAAALAAAAVALAAVGVPGARDLGGGGPAFDTAYVVKRIDSALGAAGPGQIAQMTVATGSAVMPGGTIVTTTAEEWSHGDQWRSVTNSPGGHPVYDEGSSAASVYTLVSYRTRTWSRQPGPRPAAPASGARGCAPTVAAHRVLFPYVRADSDGSAGSLPATVVTSLRTAVSCATLAVSGWQRVDGIEAIKLTSLPGSLVSEAIWVSPATYLPMRVIVRSAPSAPVRQQTADISWLKPTAQNLAKLTVPIPPGFPRVPSAHANRPSSPESPGWPRPNVHTTSAGASA